LARFSGLHCSNLQKVQIHVLPVRVLVAAVFAGYPTLKTSWSIIFVREWNKYCRWQL